jgi:outer membrane autotransporter protein
VTLNNTGASNITFMDVDLNIPSELTINSVTTDGFNCISTPFGLSCDDDHTLDIAGDESKEIIIVNVQSNTFVGEVFAEVVANLSTDIQRSDDEVTTIIESGLGTLNPDISVEIIAGDAIDQGAVSEFEVKIANTAVDVAQNVTLSMSITGILDTVNVEPGADWSCQINVLNINCQFNEESMPVNHQSSLIVTANTSQVVVEAEDLILLATLSTSSDDSNLSNNTDSSQVVVSGTPLEGEIGEAIRTALGSSGNPQVDSAIEGVSGFCENAFFTAIEGLCSDIYDAALAGDTETVRTAIEQIMPNEVIGQSTSVSEIATAQFRNVGSRLSQIRGGGGSGFSSAGLNARYGNGSIPLGMLAYLNQTDEETNGIDTNNDFISPWGFFINGTISMGDRDATSRELGFDFDTFGITAGVDYRLDAKKVVGIALGYAKFDSTIENVSELNSSGITLSGYASFYMTDNLYIDARMSYAQPEFDQSRNIDFTVGSTHIDRTALGKTDADQYSMALSTGYSFYKNSWNITPNASISYMKTTIDEFAETGAGDFNFVYLEQELESLVWSAGIRVSKAISLKNGVITPQFDFDYNYEGLNDGNDIQTRFVSGGDDDQILIVVTDTPDRSYGSAGLGLVFISANGKQAYINYRSVIGLNGFSRGTYNIGARFEF